MRERRNDHRRITPNSVFGADCGHMGVRRHLTCTRAVDFDDLIIAEPSVSLNLVPCSVLGSAPQGPCALSARAELLFPLPRNLNRPLSYPPEAGKAPTPWSLFGRGDLGVTLAFYSVVNSQHARTFCSRAVLFGRPVAMAPRWRVGCLQPSGLQKTDTTQCR
jgi:hypothetical protein